MSKNNNKNNSIDNFLFKTESNNSNSRTSESYNSKINESDNSSSNSSNSSNSSKSSKSLSSDNSEIVELETTEESKMDSNISNDDKKEYFSGSIDTDQYQDQIYIKYLVKEKKKNPKYTVEMKELIKKCNNDLEKAVIKNNLNDIKKSIESGITIYESEDGNIISLCKFSKCGKKRCHKECYKNVLYTSLRNFNRGIKSIYNILLRFLLLNPKFRINCKCCENIQKKEYLNELDKNFVSKKKNITEGISTHLEPKVLLELQISYLINKFMSIIGLLPCECLYKGRYYEFYEEKYLNFNDILVVYTITVPLVIKLIKLYYDIKDNHEELCLIKDSRCMHEDTRFNNLTYCIKKNYTETDIKKTQEIIMNIDLINQWIIDSIKISIYLYNEQSLEHYKYIMNSKRVKNITNKINRIYPLSNNYLDINFSVNRNGFINITLDNFKSIPNNNIDGLITNIIKQIETRNKFVKKNNLSEILISYITESFRRNNIILGVCFLKHIKNIKKEDKIDDLNYIFDKLVENKELTIENKISYLKMINKNKINLIEYDFVNKLIDNKDGDKIILEFNKEENTLFNIDDYKNERYITNIIKKCIDNKKINILDYVLYNLDNSIKSYDIQIIKIYLLNIPSKGRDINNIYIDIENEYIELLKIIIKYNKNFELKIETTEKKSYSIMEYCIENNFDLSAKIFIDNGIELLKTRNNLLVNCINKRNTIISRYIINKEPRIVNTFYNDFNMLNYLMNNIKKMESNILLRFIINIIKPIILNRLKENTIINYQDKKNELFGFMILNSCLLSNEKILIFNFLKNSIDPMISSNYSEGNISNYPLILHATLLDEYEITYILLNNLTRNNLIRKNVKTENPSIFNYYHTSDNININFIPLIFKFIKDNHSKYELYKKNNYPDIDDEFFNDKIIINYLLQAIGYTIYYMLLKNNNFKYDTLDKVRDRARVRDKVVDKVIDKKIKNYENKYIEVSMDTENNIVDLINTNDNSNYSSEINYIKSKNNKNIWLNKKKNKKIIEKQESSDISESEILFDNIL